MSIPANIAEGFRRKSLPDKSRFLNIAQASLEECRYYLILSRDLGCKQDEALAAKAVEASKLLTAYDRAVTIRASA